MGSGQSFPSERRNSRSSSGRYNKVRSSNSRSNSTVCIANKYNNNNNINSSITSNTVNHSSSILNNSHFNNNSLSISNNNTKRSTYTGNTEEKSLVSSSINMSGAVSEKPMPSSESNPPQHHTQDASHDHLRRVNLLKANAINKHNTKRPKQPENEWHGNVLRKSYESRGQTNSAFQSLKTMNSMEKKDINVLRRIGEQNSTSSANKSNFCEGNNDNHNKNNKNNSTSNSTSNNDQQGKSSKANSLVENVAHELTEEENRQHIFSSTSPSILVQRKAHEMRRGSRVSSKSNSHLFGEPENNAIPKEHEETITTMKETKPQSEPLSSSSLHECNEVHTPKLPQNRLLKSSKPQCGSTSKTITLPPAITPKSKKNQEQKKNSSHTSNITNHSLSGVATTPSVSTSNELFPHDLKPPPLPILQTRSSFRTSTNTLMSNTNNNTTNTMSGNSERMRGNNASPLETRHSECHLPIISLSTESVPYKKDKEENMKSDSGNGMYHLHNSGSMISNTGTSSRSNSNSVVNSNDNSLSSNILNGSTNAFKKQRETAVFNSNDFINVGLSPNGDDSVSKISKDFKIVTSNTSKNNGNSNNAVNVKKETVTSHNKANTAHPEQGSLSSLLMLQPQVNSLQSDGWSRSLNSHNESNESVLTDVAEDLQNNVMDAFIKCDTPQDSNYYSDGFEDYEEVVSNESVKSQGSDQKDNNNKKYQYLEEEEEEEEEEYLDDFKDKKESKEIKEVCQSNLDTNRKSGSPSHTKRSSKSKDKFTFGEIHNNIDDNDDDEEEESTSPTRNKQHKSQHGSNNKNNEKDNVDHAHAHRGRPNNPFQEKAQRHRNSSSRSQGLVTFYGSTQVCRVCGDSNVAYVSAKHNSPTQPANSETNNNNNKKQTNTSTSGEKVKNNKADGKGKDSKINKKQSENHKELDDEEEWETYMCEKCYFADNGVHAMVPMQEIHCMNSRTCISSSATSLTTNTNTYNWGTSSEAAISSFFYSPCAVCERIIDDAEVVYRCEKCDYIVCENCYTTRFSEVQHDDPVKRFQRRQRSDSIHETNYLCKKRDNDGNKIINDYVVVRELGKGSFAKVKLVQHIITHELFALKILKRQRSHAFNMAQFSSLHNNNNNYYNEQQQQPWPTSAPSPYLESGGNSNNEKQKKEELQEENGKENDEETTQHHHISITTDVNPLRFRSRHNSLAAGINNDDLLREIAVMKFINHPNVVELKEVIDDADANKVYVIMEYCENGPIHVWGQPPLPIEKVRRYGCDILKGLLHLHSEFLYHRDVKPANCLVDSHNVAKLADFGACTSRIMSAATEGTLAYSSPEQVRGENVAGDVVDSWAFAMTLYESAFGELPFKIDSVSTWQKQLSSSEEIAIPLTIKYPVKSVNPIATDNTNGDVNSTKNMLREVPVDADFRDLLQRMFCKNLSKRMLLSEAAAHPFFTNVQDIDLAASLRSFGSLLRSIQVAGCNRPSVSELYDKALDAVHRGSHVQNSFHGVRAMKKIQRKSKKSKLNDFMDLLDEESLENQEDSLYELTLDTNKVEDNNIESKEKQTVSNVNSKNIVNTQFTFPTREYDLALSPQEMALPCDEEEKQLVPHIEAQGLETNVPMANKETKTVSATSTIGTNTDKVNVQESKMGEVNNKANVSSDTKCVKYVQVRMKELPASLYESKATLERLVCQGNALSSVNTLNFNIFTQLKDVAITHNCLTQFPISLLRTPHLLRLDLSCNNIKIIPPELCHARFLERLNLHNNAIQEVGVIVKKPVMEFQKENKNNNENNNNENNSNNLNEILLQNVKSVLAAPCLRHVRLTNNELVRLPLALYSTNASLELVLDANPKLMNEWNELLHDQTQSLPILTSYVDKSSNNKTENTHHDDKSNAKRKNSLSAKSLPATSDLIEKKRNKSSGDKKKKKKKKKEKQEKINSRRKSSGKEFESEENKLATMTKDKSKVNEKKLSQEVPQDEWDAIHAALRTPLLNNTLRGLIRRKTVIVWDDAFPARVANTIFPVWIASGVLNGYNIHTLQSCQAQHVVLFKAVDKRLPCGEFTSTALQLYLKGIVANNNNTVNNTTNTKGNTIMNTRLSHEQGHFTLNKITKPTQLTSINGHVFKFVNSVDNEKGNNKADRINDHDDNKSVKEYKRIMNKISRIVATENSQKEVNDKVSNKKETNVKQVDENYSANINWEEMCVAPQLSPSITEISDINNSIENVDEIYYYNNNSITTTNNNNGNAPNNGSRRSSMSSAPLPPLVNKEACHYVSDYFIVSDDANNADAGYWALFHYLERVLTQSSLSCTTLSTSDGRRMSTASPFDKGVEQTNTNPNTNNNKKSSLPRQCKRNSIISTTELQPSGHSVLIVVNGGSGAAHDTRELTIAAVSALLNKLSPTLTSTEVSCDNNNNNNNNKKKKRSGSSHSIYDVSEIVPRNNSINNDNENAGLQAKFEDVMAAMKGMYE